MFERFLLFEYSFSKSLDIPFLNCLILPERSLHPGITSVLLRLLSPPFLFLYIPSFDRFLFGVPPPPFYGTISSTVYSYSFLIRFAHFAAFAGPFLRRLRPTPYRVTGNGSHNYPRLLLWSRYFAVGFHHVINALNAIA